MPTRAAPARLHLFDLLAEHPRVLVVGGRASGKTALVNLLAAQAAWRDLGFGLVVPIVVAANRLEQSHLDETEIARQNPSSAPKASGTSWTPGAGC